MNPGKKYPRCTAETKPRRSRSAEKLRETWVATLTAYGKVTSPSASSAGNFASSEGRYGNHEPKQLLLRFGNGNE
jgi:hypothetical protein